MGGRASSSTSIEFCSHGIRRAEEKERPFQKLRVLIFYFDSVTTDSGKYLILFGLPLWPRVLFR